MANKKSFVMYESWAKLISGCPDEQAGQLIKAICNYKLGHEVKLENPMVKAMFDMIRETLDKDSKKYDVVCEKRKEAIEKRWGNKSIEKNTNEYKCIQTDTDTESESESDTESDTESESDTDSDNGNIYTAEAIQAETVFIRLKLKGNSEYPVTFKMLDEYKNLHPNLNVEQELRNMCGWCNSNPRSRKTKAGIERFISGWFSRSEERVAKGNSYMDAINNRVGVVDTWN